MSLGLGIGLGSGGVTSLSTTALASSLTNNEATAVVCGAPVYANAAAGFLKAKANAAGTQIVIGLVGVSPSIAAGAAGAVAHAGPLTLTTTEWDAVTGQAGGLTTGVAYYLDPTTAGKLTTTAPSAVTQYVREVGIALSTTTMLVRVGQGVLL